MKNPSKFILPSLIVVIAAVIYFFYFSTFKGLGAFSDFDPYSHVQRDITVKVVQDLGIKNLYQTNQIMFYAEDRNGEQTPITVSKNFTRIIEQHNIITLTGHICNGSFQVADIKVD
ncbi:MAG: hypothetical protein K8F60_02820 [Melioribacteraceae bacterium]|nr:hypothetical protein [Melioribacteraceae bacterium]